MYHHKHGLQRKVTVRQCSVSANIPMVRPQMDKSNMAVSFPMLAAGKVTNRKAIGRRRDGVGAPSLLNFRPHVRS